MPGKVNSKVCSMVRRVWLTDCDLERFVRVWEALIWPDKHVTVPQCMVTRFVTSPKSLKPLLFCCIFSMCVGMCPSEATLHCYQMCVWTVGPQIHQTTYALLIPVSDTLPLSARGHGDTVKKHNHMKNFLSQFIILPLPETASKSVWCKPSPKNREADECVPKQVLY